MKQIKDRDLFSVKSGKHGVKRSKKKGKGPKSKKTKKEEKSDETDLCFDKHVPISYKNIHAGQIILGSILHVYKYHIIVCLPNRMTGYLPVMHLSKSYNDLLTKVSEGKAHSIPELKNLYSQGHLLVLKVISVESYKDGNSKINLSALPEDVNCELSASLLSKHSVVQCAVVSQEENGYIMETGIRNIRSAFLPLKYAHERSFGVGSVLLCAVKETIADMEDTGQIGIKLSARPSYVNKEVKFLEGKINVASIFPGTIVSGTIAKVTPEGLVLSFGEFRGFVKKENLTSRAEKLEDFKNGQKILARVLYITELTSEIVCSMNAKLCSESALTSELSSLSIDNIYSGNFLMSLSDGDYFTLPEDTIGFCPRKYWDKKKKQLPSSASYKCRVTHIHLIDQLYSVVLESDEIASGALFHAGKLVSVKIAEHNSNGALALIIKTKKIGRIPKHHLTDSNMSHPEEKCRIGNVFKGRILNYSPGNDPLLTLKTDLVTSELPIVTELGENSVGTVTLGCIVKIYRNNLLVEFFNDCRALVLGKDIPAHLRKNLNAHFQIGSVVKCKVTSYIDTEKKLYASLIANVASDKNVTGDSKVKSKSESLSKSPTPEDIVNCKIISVNKENIDVTIEGSNEKACIPLYHFSDDVGASKSMFRLLNEGDEIKNAVVFAKSKSDFILSVKPSVYHYVKEFKNLELEKKVCPGVVKQCFEDKIVVSVMGKKDKSEHVIRNCNVIREKIGSVFNIGMEEGQTLFLSRSIDEKKIFCSHLSKVLSNARTSGLQVLYDTLLQEAMIRKLCSEMKSLKLKDAVIGAFYEGKIIHISKAGALVRISELGLDGVIHPSHYNDFCIPTLNETLEVRVLNVNYYELCLELTARKDIEKYFCKKEHNLEVQQDAKCDILLAKKKYIIGRLLSLCPGQIIYLPSRRHINDFKGRHSYYETGKQYDIVIEHIDEELVLANLKVHTKEKYLDVSKEIPSFTFSSLYLRNFVDDLLLDETRYTHHDFKMRASAKIERVSKWSETKKNVENLDKWKILKEDKFSQIDEEIYWKNVLERREARKKLKKEKLGPIKVKKRKFNESFDENVVEDDEMSDDDPEEDVTADQSDNLVTSVQRKTRLNNETKKRKLDIINQKMALKDNYDHENEQENENVNGDNSDLEAMSEDDSHNSNADKMKMKKKKLGLIKVKRSKLNESFVENFADDDGMNNDSEEDVTADQSDNLATSLQRKPRRESKIKKRKLDLINQKKALKDSHDSNTDEIKDLNVEIGGFDFRGQITETPKEDSESSCDDEIEETKEQKSVKKLSKYEKSLKGKAEEKRTRELELERLDDEREPETALDFEEKIEQNPHSSAMWIEYISFHLEKTEPEKARAVASRALATIPPTKEEERLALWNVCLRLEVMYGTSESVQNSFKEALSRNDELKIYNIMIDIYLNDNKLKEADELIKKIVKKHSQNREVWIKSFVYLFKANEFTEARNMLDRSLLSLPKSDHVEVINRFAQLELKLGDPERGITMFETLVGNFPKRLDIWNVYADLLLKQKDIEGSRTVLERITGLKLKMVPMRNAFKKLLEFEKKFGTPQRIEAVKSKVEEYVNAALAQEK